MNKLPHTVRRLVPALLLCAALPLAQASTTFPSTPPKPGPAPVLHVPTPTSTTLANGLQVVVVRRPGLPLVTAQLLVRAGGETDPAGKAGLADLTATLLTRGAAGRGAPQIAAEAAALGGSLDTGAGWDVSSLGITVTTPKLAKALRLMADVARRPDFADAELERARKQALDGLRLRLSQPTGMASLLAARAVYGDGAYGHSRYGTPASLAHIDRDDVVRQHAAWYRPDNAILVFAGDLDAARAEHLAKDAFGDWKRPRTALPAVPAAVGASRAPSLLVVDQPGGGQAGVVAAHLGIRRDAADYYVGEVANAVLGGSYSARLNEEIRIKRGLSYGAFSGLDARRSDGLWLAQVQTKNPSATQVVGLVHAQFERLRSEPVAAAELAARKATLAGSYGRSLETTAGLADRVGDLALYGLELDRIGRYVDAVQAVTPQQVQAFARSHLGADGVHMVVVGDAGVFGAALHKAYPQAQTLAIDKVDLDRPLGSSGR